MTARGISREDVLGAAVSILDSGGLPSLAMRRIADELGVRQSALYWHFSNKQELLAGVADRILEQVAAPAGLTWQDRLTELALNLRAELLVHQDGAELVATAFAFRLGAKDPLRHFAAELAREGFDPANGARPLRRLVRSHVEDPIAEAVLSGRMAAGDRLKLKVEENTLVIAVEKE